MGLTRPLRVLLLLSTVSALSSFCTTSLGQAVAPEATKPAPAPADDRIDEATARSFQAPETKPYVDLTHRYRFIEAYTKVEERAHSGLVGQYIVGMSETLHDSVDSVDGKPKESDVNRQTIYVERPAEVSGLGFVNAVVRQYSRFVVRPESQARVIGPRPLDGLTVYYRPRQGEPPEIMSLQEDRRLREREYEIASRQLFLPSLHTVFPGYPARVGDSWRVGKRGVQALLGEPMVKGDNLLAKFVELRREDKGTRLYAIMTITGQVNSGVAETAINAQIEFAFDPPTAAKSTTASTTSPVSKPSEASTIEARGAITEVRLARIATGFLPNTTEKLKFTASQQLVLRRKIGVEASGGILLKTFEAPTATDVNSWITYSDAKSRFLFNHPQDLLPPEKFQLTGTANDDSVVLQKSRPDGKEMIRIDLFRKSMEPDALQDVLNAEWKRIRAEVLPGPSEWLPDAEFPTPMKVYRIESALKLGDRGARLHYDSYLVKLSENASLMVIATTSRDGIDKFRADVERLIRSFKLIPDSGS